MKKAFTFFFGLVSLFAFGQTIDDAAYLKQQAKTYINQMYVEKRFDSAAAMLDKRVFSEMESFYKKRKQGHLTDSILYKRLKADITKYHSQVEKFTIHWLSNSPIQTTDNHKIASVGFGYTEILKGNSERKEGLLIFISEDKGKSWVMQDWKIAEIADLVDKKIL